MRGRSVKHRDVASFFVVLDSGVKKKKTKKFSLTELLICSSRDYKPQ